MAQPQNGRLTASPLKMPKIFFYKALEKMGLAPPHTEIHNYSDRPIFLIPICGTRGADPLPNAPIKDNLAKKIPVGETRLVNSTKYDCHDVNNQIRILFRAGNRDTESLGEFLGNLSTTAFREERGEKLYPHNFLLYKRDLYLKYENGKVTEINEPGQPQEAPDSQEGRVPWAAGGLQDEEKVSFIERVIPILEELCKDSPELQAAVANLKGAFDRSCTR